METFAKDYIIDALFLLMEKEDFEKITVTQICAKAGVSRLSYYRLFSSKEDIVKSFFLRSQDEFTKVYPALDIQLDQTAKVRAAFQGMRNHRKEFDCILKNHLEGIYLDYLNKSFADKFKKLKIDDAELVPYIYAGILYNVSISWAKNNYQEDVETMTDQVLHAIMK